MRRFTLLAVFGLLAAACGGDSSEPTISQPQIDSVSPAWGAPGAEVAIHGSNFATDSPTVSFGVAAATTVTPVNASRILAVVPAAASPGLLDVRVANPDGGSATLTDGFEVVIPPVVDSVSPTQGTIGTEVRIYGANFATDSVQVFFGGFESPRVLQEAGSVFALAPEGLTLGNSYDIRLVNRDMAADTLLAAYEVVGPNLLRINGVTKPTGLRGMTIIMDGSAFGDSLALSNGKVYFTDDAGAPVEALVVDTLNDWTDTFIVTSVPDATADTSWVWVETVTGASDSIEFRITAEGSFSPSEINWTKTTPMPQALQGLGAVFVPVEEGASPANYVFVVGGADTLNVATDVVYRATVAQTGELGASWSSMTPLPEKRAYHTTAAATAFTAALDTATTAAYLYALGGIDTLGAVVSTVHYAHVDLAGDVGSWQATTPLPEPLHSAGTVMFRGYLYLMGGADTLHAAVNTVYRIKVNADGSLGSAWESLPSVPTAASYAGVVGFGPYMYVIGGETGTADPISNALTSTETAVTYFARINVRTAGLTDAGWMVTEEMAKARSKHSAIFGGGSLLVTSGLYAGGQASSENTFANLLSDGSLEPWQGATGAEIIDAELGYSLYNQAAITFIDQAGTGHVLVIGGAQIENEGVPSAEVVYY